MLVASPSTFGGVAPSFLPKVDAGARRGPPSQPQGCHGGQAHIVLPAAGLISGLGARQLRNRRRWHRLQRQCMQDTDGSSKRRLACDTGNCTDRRSVVAVAAPALLGASLWMSQPEAARAGPFVNFLSTLLPVKEAVQAQAQLDYTLRDAWGTFTEDNFLKVAYQPEDVADAAGAEAAVFAAADAAARKFGLEVAQVARRAQELEEQEARRFRADAESAIFPSELVGRTTIHFAQQVGSYGFRAYCRWKAYAEALGALPAGVGGAGGAEEVEAAGSGFNAEFGRQLLATVLKDAPPPPDSLQPLKAKTFLESLSAFLQTMINADLVAMARLDEASAEVHSADAVDDVLVEAWGEGITKNLTVPIVVQGDPLADTQVLFAEKLQAGISPNPALAALGAWLSKLPTEPSRSSAALTSFNRYYVTTKFRKKSEKKVFKYVPQSQMVQIVLQRGFK
eukprot:TRINITY_DN82827_c0_g1_i1.p1 TRINITY_DN82827_c0_g1~~TRINITY_DN82827_c0_g1_i1.p1  ORF type:complete len:484 (-),score=94.33 TRINITY_DN82827_c0_g1_i1:47-1402(-)